MPPQNFPYSYHKILPRSWNQTYTCQQIFHAHHVFVQSSLYSKFFITTMPLKVKPKFIQQHHILHALPRFHESSTLSKLHHAKKLNNSKNTPKPRLQHDQPYNVQNFNKSKRQQNDNVSTSNSQWNMNSTNFPTKKQKNKLTLKSMLEWGAWVLGSWRSPFSSFHSRDEWYFFSMKSEKRWWHYQLEDGDIINAKKKEVWKWVSQNGCVAKMANNTRIWKNIEDEWREVEKLRKVFF